MDNKKRNRFSKILDCFIIIVFLLSLSYLGLSFLEYKYPYEYNYYFNKIVNKIDIKKTTLDKHNDYYRDYDFLYVQNSKYLYAENKQDLINILYTLSNSGQYEVEFYCSKEYKDCVNDANKLIYDTNSNVIGKIFQFNHPFNDYDSISCGGDPETLKVVYRLYKKYSSNKIEIINKEVDRIFNELYDSNLDTISNIYKFHDYLVNNIEYDKDKSNYIEGKSTVDSNYDSTTAYGALIEHKAICSGYTDAMYLFLDKLNLKSIRVASETHVWNAVYINDKWLHLDVTWDDSKYTNGKPFLSHRYFLIDTPTLHLNDTDSHWFDKQIYKELS